MITTILDGLSPADFNLPSQFKTYRPVQREASEYGLLGTGQGKRFRFIGAPPGAGKTAIAHTIGQLSGLRYAVVTATRGLQEQQLNDKLATRDGKNLDEFLCFNIQGKNNYLCNKRRIMSRIKNTCDQGYDNYCPDVGTKRCKYTQALNLAKTKPVLTNYQYWMNARSRNRAALDEAGGLGEPIELLILDECHKSSDELARFLGVWISRDHLAQFGEQGMLGKCMRTLKGKEWAFVGIEWLALLDVMTVRLEQAMKHIMDQGNSRFADGFPTEELAYREDEDYRAYDELMGKVGRLKVHGGDGNWIWKPGRTGVEFDCVWPYRYAEQYLFQGVPNVVGMSATLRPKAMSLLGLKRKDYDFKEWPRQFPAQYSPVYFWPLGRMGTSAPQEDVERVCWGIDQWHLARSDRKMMIHSASYDRAEMFQAKCIEAGRHMILSKPGEAMIAFEKFKLAPPGAVLSSPSFMTGWDAPGVLCEVNIVPKIPFSFRGDHVFQAREQSDPTYELYKVGQDVVQAFGRSTRFDGDRSEGVMLDAAWHRFQWAAKDYLPRWFGCRKIDKIPRCPPKM